VRAARSASAELRAPGPVSNARWRAPARPGLRPPPGTSHPGHPNSLARRTAGPGWSAARRVHDVHVDAAAQAAIVVGAVERQRQLVDAVQRPGRRVFDAVVHRHRRVLMHGVHAAAERAQELQQVRPRELRARARSGSAGGRQARARARCLGAGVPDAQKVPPRGRGEGPAHRGRKAVQHAGEARGAQAVKAAGAQRLRLRARRLGGCVPMPDHNPAAAPTQRRQALPAGCPRHALVHQHAARRNWAPARDRSLRHDAALNIATRLVLCSCSRSGAGGACAGTGGAPWCLPRAVARAGVRAAAPCLQHAQRSERRGGPWAPPTLGSGRPGGSRSAAHTPQHTHFA